MVGATLTEWACREQETIPRLATKRKTERRTWHAWRRLRRANAKKRAGELAFWRERLAAEGVLRSELEYFFTEHFGLDRSFYDGARVLDIGCGPRGTLEWADMARERVGLDPLADAYRELGTAGHAMRYVAGPAERIPFPDGHFDVVSAFNALDHVDDLEESVREIKRVLAPGGTFLLVTEVGHEPTWEEPQDFGWEVIGRFGPELDAVTERHYEHRDGGVHQSAVAGKPFDHADDTVRPGILSARLRKRS